MRGHRKASHPCILCSFQACKNATQVPNKEHQQRSARSSTSLHCKLVRPLSVLPPTLAPAPPPTHTQTPSLPHKQGKASSTSGGGWGWGGDGVGVGAEPYCEHPQHPPRGVAQRRPGADGGCGPDPTPAGHGGRLHPAATRDIAQGHEVWQGQAANSLGQQAAARGRASDGDDAGSQGCDFAGHGRQCLVVGHKHHAQAVHLGSAWRGGKVVVRARGIEGWSPRISNQHVHAATKMTPKSTPQSTS